ncbi:MAG TPA: hypothetical protein VK648_02855 [Gemmatimonadaceae bacterium]|nr:hypothetical protein [Gemmatimonadaceae bacterium]
MTKATASSHDEDQVSVGWGVYIGGEIEETQSSAGGALRLHFDFL